MEKFRWNIYADQPHNIAPRKERFKYHLKHGASYLSLVSSNLRLAFPGLRLYRKYWKGMYRKSCRIQKPFAVSVSPTAGRDEEVLENLKETGVNKSLVRIPSWERDNFSMYEKFLELLYKDKIDLTIALLQQREDVLKPSHWKSFMEDAFSRFGRLCSFFEIGHSWNRTKWGVWDYKEYLKLARPAISLAQRYGVKLIGPAVIDFEFHLYPPVLKVIPFDKVSSLLYVDRYGAPENKQFGWDTARKIALLKAIIDCCSKERQGCWITEVNWPLKGTGKYSPASGKPNVSEEEQANYLVRYFVICLASGFVERVYWWQLVAPGYGLIDSHQKEWRHRPSFYALRTLVRQVGGSTFIEKAQDSRVKIFMFNKGREDFAVCWTGGIPCDYFFPRKIKRVLNRDGREIQFFSQKIKIEGNPKYIFFENRV
ncbi:MAG: hypothetical protein ACETWK_11905 [Candidatus Aminicenantaceae bacterium]